MADRAEEQRLVGFLRAIYCAAPSRSEATWQARCLLGTAWAKPAGGQAHDALADLEHVLAGAVVLAGRDGFKVEEAKGWLRTFGDQGRKLASELGGLSKPRNGRAHPRGAQLLGRIGALVLVQATGEYLDTARPCLRFLTSSFLPSLSQFTVWSGPG